jgi:ABC-type sugar transport system ATPase subunit
MTMTVTIPRSGESPKHFTAETAFRNLDLEKSIHKMYGENQAHRSTFIGCISFSKLLKGVNHGKMGRICYQQTILIN